MQVAETAIGPNSDAANLHLTTLFGRCIEEYPGGMMELRCIHFDRTSNSGTKLIKANLFIAGEFSAAIAWACEMNAQGFNIYVGINPRKPGTPPFGAASSEDVEIAFFQFADLDREDSINILRDTPLIDYTFAVTTGTIPTVRPHIYFELETPSRNMTAWTDVQIGLKNYFKSDAVIDPPRIMRLAGMISYPNTKKAAERGYVTETVTIRTEYEDDRQPISSVLMYNTFAGIKDASIDKTVMATSGDPLALNTWGEGINPERCISNIKSGQELHNNTRDLVAHMVGTGSPDWEITALCNALLIQVSDGGTIAQLGDLINSARGKYNMSNVPKSSPPLAADGTILPLPFDWFSEMTPSIDTIDLIEDTLGDGQMSVIYGESNCGKTFFMTDVCFHVAMGLDWRNLVVDQRLVIYCALEGKHGIRNRIAALRRHHGITPRIPFIIITTSINILNPDADIQRLLQSIKQAEEECGIAAGLIVLDTLSRALSGGNENSPDDMGALVVNTDAVRLTTGAHVAFIHHSGKDQAKGARGHSLLRAATDTEIEITRNDDVSVATIMKQREYEGNEKYGFTLKGIELGENKNGKIVTSCVIEPIEIEKGKRVGRPLKINGTGKQALEILKALINEQGTTHHNTEEFPVGIKMVTEENFKSSYEAAGVAPDGRDSQYYRNAVKNLQNTGHIIIHKNYVWELLCGESQ